MSVGKKLLFDFTSSELQSEVECSIGYNVLRLGEGCLTERSKFAESLWQLLPNRCYK